jgi:hypothetical protein
MPLLLDQRPFGGPIRAEDIVRWGVWLGRHIC